MPKDINSLPWNKRARHYRRMAKNALNAARAARTPLCQDELTRLAHGWHDLAMQVEQILPEVEPDDVESDSD
jgi:hypothetical protein